jgi:hypothetical protein
MEKRRGSPQEEDQPSSSGNPQQPASRSASSCRREDVSINKSESDFLSKIGEPVFMSSVDRLLGPCWPWIGFKAKRENGVYGCFGNSPNRDYAHRISYRFFIGPIPSSLTVDHLCRNTLCVNPNHLEAVPRAVNVLRGNGYSGINTRKTHCIHGHLFDQINTYIPCRTGRKPGRQCRQCRRELQGRTSS